MKKVVVADDTALTRATYVDVLGTVCPGVPVDEVATGRDLVAYVLGEDPSVVFSDMAMETRDAGLVALRAIRGAENNVPFYILSSDDVGKAALENGATGFYRKTDGNLIGFMKGVASQYLSGAE